MFLQFAFYLMQNRKSFSFKMFFEDAIGNKDSIIIGFDPNATNGIDEDFGEVNIYNAMWTKDLELRAGETSSGIMNNYDTTEAIINSKIQISKKTCDFFDMTKFIFKCKNFPLKISWDTTAFSSDSCLYSSYITTGTAWGGDWIDGVFAFLNPINENFVSNKIIINNDNWIKKYLPVYHIINSDTIYQGRVSFAKKRA